uniref:Uncharacterized protein n=1 Tax=Rhizophora mucronata TaxID=61149 RepID=A0A2P2LHT9_RHIMU
MYNYHSDIICTSFILKP